MANKESLLLVGTLEPVEIGEVFDSTPAHVTILPWLSLQPGQQEVFDHIVPQVIGDYLPLEITGEQEAFFGPKNDLRVRKVGSKAIHLLHNELLVMTTRLGVEMRDVWIGSDYAPHVTYKGEIGIEQDQKIVLDSLQLFSRESKDSQRKVKRIYSAGSTE